MTNSNNPEQLNNGPERSAETSGETAREQLEKLANNAERGIEAPHDGEKSAERARHEALESAISVESGGAETYRDSEPAAAPVIRRGPISKKQRENSYKRTMKQVQAELPPVERTFSKIIHNKAIEKTSEVVGSTVARPNAILAGAIFAFVLTLITYLVAKNIGYSLSGFETIAAFVIGWVVGILYDYLRLLVTGKKS